MNELSCTPYEEAPKGIQDKGTKNSILEAEGDRSHCSVRGLCLLDSS